MTILDTHRAIEKIINTGVSKGTAEAIVDAISSKNDDLATKLDIVKLEVKIDNDITKLESKIDNNTAELKTDIAELRTSVNWLKAISIGTFLMLLGSLATILFKQI